MWTRPPYCTWTGRHLCPVKMSSLQKKLILTNVDKTAILHVDRPPFVYCEKVVFAKKLILTNVDKAAILHVDSPPFVYTMKKSSF
jgi:hypothetical protein